MLPGKFSFFPTVALQTYLRVREFFGLGAPLDRGRYAADRATEERARRLVADHYPLRILAEEEGTAAAGRRHEREGRPQEIPK